MERKKKNDGDMRTELHVNGCYFEVPRRNCKGHAFLQVEDDGLKQTDKRTNRLPRVTGTGHANQKHL